jgi:hypothetical protein
MKDQPSSHAWCVIWLRDGKLLQLGEGEGARARDHAVDREPPVGEAARQQPLIGLRRRRFAVHRGHLRDLAAVELTRH